jgi:hypothetical protein
MAPAQFSHSYWVNWITLCTAFGCKVDAK